MLFFGAMISPSFFCTPQEQTAVRSLWGVRVTIMAALLAWCADLGRGVVADLRIGQNHTLWHAMAGTESGHYITILARTRL